MKYHAEFVTQLCNELIDIANDPDPHRGICTQLTFGVRLWVKDQFKYWEHYSGDKAYPVPPYYPYIPDYTELHNEYGYAALFGMMWDTDTEYGRMRWDLLAFLLERASKLEVK